MSYLLDTNVVSEARKPHADAGVRAWLAEVDDRELYVSVLVLGEIRQGIERLRPRDPERAQAYEAWLDTLRGAYADRIVPIDARTTDEWGRLNALRPVPVVDGLMAATAKVRDWTLVTRNVADVRATGVRVLDPFRG